MGECQLWDLDMSGVQWEAQGPWSSSEFCQVSFQGHSFDEGLQLFDL